MLFSLLDRPAHAQDVAYGAYGHFPVGSTRVLAMGGAFVGLSDDASAVVTNPAGLSLARYTVDLTGGENRIVNREVFFGTNPNDREGLPYTSVFQAGALRLGPVGFGVGYSVPYALKYSAGGTLATERILKIESLDAALSLGVSKAVSFGVTAHTERVRIAYHNADGTEPEAKVQMVYPTYGVLFHLDKKAGAGITYTPERRYNVDENLDAQLSGAATDGVSEWFHDVVIPAKVTLGLSVQSTPKLRWVGDIDIVQPVKNAIFVGGSENDSGDRILEKQQTIMHGGFEFNVLDSKEMDFVWRGGGYREPARMSFSSDRFHFTMGVEARFHFIVVAASYDQAPGFSNVAQSVSVSFGEL